MRELSDKDEIFCQEYIINRDASKAFRKSRPNSKASDKTVWENASRLLKSAKVSARITDLMQKASKDADEKFAITVEWRLQKLKEITDAGLSLYNDAQGNARRENLAAARAAIQTMNEMLGTGREDKTDIQEKITVVIQRDNSHS